MGWFDEQIRQRIQSDDDVFADAFAAMAGAVAGERLSKALSDDRIQTKNAIDEILKFYGIKTRELPDNIRTADEQLEFLMRPSGIMRRTVVLEGRWYKNAVGAMLCTRKDNGLPVALIPGKLFGYTFYDTESGKRLRVTDSTAKLLDNEAYCFYKPLPLKKIGTADLIRYILGTVSFSDRALICISTLVVTLIGMLVPKIHNVIYSHVVNSTSIQLLLAVFTFLFCSQLSQLIITAVKTLIVDRISQKMGIAAEAGGMMRMLSLPAEFFKKYGSGDLANRMAYIGELCSLLTGVLFTTGLSSLFSLLYIGQMFRYGPGLVVPGLTVILLTVIFSVITAVIQVRLMRTAMAEGTEEASLTYSLISGIQKIKLSGAEKRAFAKWANKYAKAAKPKYTPVIPFGSFIALVGTVVIYYFTITTNVPLADYYSFTAAYGAVTGAFTLLVGMGTSIAQIKPILEMVKPILEAVPEIDENKKVVTRLSGGIELNNVSFRYNDNMPMIIDDLSLKIRPGQYVAIVGTTGCGKSTLMRLMLGFEKPCKGAVYYDGKDIASLDLKSLRKNIGTVMQNGKLFQGDIFSNITISAPELTMDRAWEAAEMAGVAEDIRNMPMGMHTIISEGSGGISGGQRQRLMIARAVAPKPKVLMFDEATSALDNITQKIVSDSLDNLKCTRIVIAHRLSTIRQCDRIIVLDKGRIIEDGTYEELIGQNGFFAKLVERQRPETVTAAE